MLICNYNFLRLWYKGLTFESNVTFRETLSASPLLWNFCDQKAGELTKYLSHRPVRESYTKLLICADLVTNLLARKKLKQTFFIDISNFMESILDMEIVTIYYSSMKLAT
jgi:hypothetical protein